VSKASFKIYDASAGSGKTFSLVKEYLILILSSKFYNSHRQILAITFTNKAANEMKARILDNLYQFSVLSDIEKAPPMFNTLVEALDLNPELLIKRSKKHLKQILHNYAFFDVSTIDKFTHRLIRTFAKDLKLAQNFEVVLDLDLVLEEAVNRLLNKAGTEKNLTQVLLSFALEKIDDDKSWNIGWDLKNIGKLLFEENHEQHISKLKNKSLDDFITLKRHLRQKIKSTSASMRSNANSALELITENGLDATDFVSGYFPKFMLKIKNGDFAIDFNAAWKKEFENKPLYSKSRPEEVKSILDKLHPDFISIFKHIRTHFYQYAFLKNCYGNLVPLTLMNALKKEVIQIQEERDILPISSFNTLIAKEIKNQPAPFIYERLGEKYRYYFIDEFQDTSSLQWNNLIPLVHNAITSEDINGERGMLLLVGDAKQAIYRWRGGKAEQLLNLIAQKENPFALVPSTSLLTVNRRSSAEIIGFNNTFFQHILPFLNEETYRELYAKASQQENAQKNGLVTLSFIDKTGNADELYGESVLKTIQSVRRLGYQYRDICILTRARKHGIQLADFLMHKKIPIVSSETLLLRSSAKVKFLINLLEYAMDPSNLNIAYDILHFLIPASSEKHVFFVNYLKNLDTFLYSNYNFEITQLHRISVFDSLEIALKQFQLLNGSDAHITHFMDMVWEVEQKEGTAIHDFLSFWETKKDTASISIPDTMNAVRIMTIHKSKGLEFPIVIFPYADGPMYRQIDPKLWLPVSENDLPGFQEILLSKKPEMKEYSALANVHFEQEQGKLELDAFNILYVALTRAINGLFIISKKDLSAKGQPKLDYYSGLFIHYLQEKKIWDTDKTSYTFGDLKYISQKSISNFQEQNISYTYTYKDRPSFQIISTAGALWGSEKERALLTGNTIHLLLEKIKYISDIENAFTEMQRSGAILLEEVPALKTKINELVYHPNLTSYYANTKYTIRNEQELITKEGTILRPDRIVLNNQKATIIDYKTGQKKASYAQQLNQYATALEDMGYDVECKILIYIHDTISTEFI